MADGLMSREEREAIRGEAERIAKRLAAGAYVTDYGRACDEDWLGKAVPALLAHADAADKLLREARDVLNQIVGGTYGWAACDVSTKITRAIGDGNG